LLREPSEEYEYFTFVKPHQNMSPYDVCPDFLMMALWWMHNIPEDRDLSELTESLEKSLTAY
jgi:hypothetical protein